MLERGKYIVIEGQDGTGKTTQADLLKERLEAQGKKVIHIKEPGGSPIAEEIRKVILNGSLERSAMTNILLFTAIRHELWHNVIKPALDSGRWVVCTRNYWSTLTYQGRGEGMDVNIIHAITKTFTSQQYMTPDFGLILYFADHEARRKRVSERGALENPDTFETQNDAFQDRVNAGYREVAKDLGITLIDASQSIEQVQAEIVELLKS